MQVINVDNLQFLFPDEWSATKYDDWKYYKNGFNKIQSGIKAVDILAVDTMGTTWLIEVKDYRVHRRTKSIDLADEFCIKILHTLAAMIPAKVHANEAKEKSAATAVARSKRLRAVFHIEQQATHSKLFPRTIDPASVYQKIRRMIKPIDAHPLVVEKRSESMNRLEWSVI